MEDCKTPVIEEPAGLKFNFTPTPTNIYNNNILNKNNKENPHKIKNNYNNNVEKNDTKNILSILPHKLRCFTPGVEVINSPNISPIFDMNNGSLNLTRNIEQQQQGNVNNDSSNSLSMNLSESSQNNNNQINTSNDSEIKLTFQTSILNQSLSVERMLMLVGLEEYTDRFEKAGIDIVQFLNIKAGDLHKLGLDCDKHCKILMELVNKLNTSA